MAEICPHCGTDIASQLRKCPNCGCDCLVTQEFCPECEYPLNEEPQDPSDLSERSDLSDRSDRSDQSDLSDRSDQSDMSDSSAVPSTEEEEDVEEDVEETSLKSLLMRKQVLWGAAAVILLILLGTGIYFFLQYRTDQRELADYKRLEGTTNPEYYQKFLNDYPDGKYFDEIRERMLILQSEAVDWDALQRNITRTGVTNFMQQHPNSLHQRTCEDMLDSIDWKAALDVGSEDAFNKYLTDHPSGRYAGEAADKMNAVQLAKVSSREKRMVQSTLQSFFTNAIGNQDIDAARAAIIEPFNFNTNQDATAETVIDYASKKMESDVIGLHYDISSMEIHKETLSDNDLGYAVKINLQETINRSDTNKPTERHYQVNAMLNYEYKIIRIIIL